MNSRFRRLDFSDVALYGVTPRLNRGTDIVSKAEAALKGGLDALQARFGDLTDRDALVLGRALKSLCAAHDALFLVNDRVDLAVAIDADGVHLGQDNLPAVVAREMLGHRKLVGVSCHALPEALQAQKDGADYVSCGPVWATPTKPDYAATGLGLVGLYKAALRVPFVVIGGVNEANIAEVVKTGARTVAVVRALFDAADPGAVAGRMRAALAPNWDGVLI